MNRQVVNRTDLLNWLIRKFGYKSYLEIGVYKPERNFDKIQCRVKKGVDPKPKRKGIFAMTSDEYFESRSSMVDLIFVDGLHEEKQVIRDLTNALSVLTANGAIVMHDCNPPTEWHQRKQKGAGSKGWNGTAWKAYAYWRMTKPHLWMGVIDVDWGLGVIRRGAQKLYPQCTIDYPLLSKDRRRLLNIVELEEIP